MKEQTINLNDKGNPICPYCNAEAQLTDSKVVYGKSYGMIYLCKNWPNCDAYVGTHPDNKTPLGTLANKELREWRKKAKKPFNKLWREDVGRILFNVPATINHKDLRTYFYKWLSEQLNIPIEETHFGMFDIDTCKRVYSLLKEKGL